jgi:hypothetical protein
MGLGIAVVLVGFGGSRSNDFYNACHDVNNVVRRITAHYDKLSFVQLSDEEIFVLDVKENKHDPDASKKMISLPSLERFTVNWKDLLREISAVIEGAIVAIKVDGIDQAALNGKIFGVDG